MAGNLGMMDPEMLEGLFGEAGDSIVLTDAEERVLYINEAGLELLELQKLPPQKKFSDICRLVNVITGEPFPSPLAKAMRTNKACGLAQDIGVMRSDGSAYLSATCSPMSHSGRVTGCFIILRNITRLRVLERHMAEEERYMHAVFAVASVGLCILDKYGDIQEINARGLEIMQTTEREALGVQFGDAFCCENSLERGCGHSLACRHCPVRNNIEAAVYDENFKSEFNVLIHSARSKKKKIWLKILLSQAGFGSERRIVLSMVDESDRKTREHELEQMRMAAEEASRAKSRFLANMSHEIRTPMNGMSGMIELAMREPMSERQRECLNNARQCSRDLLAISNDILDFSKLDSGHVHIHIAGMDMYALIRRIRTIYGPLAESKGLKLIVPREQDLPHFIRSDSLRLRQILRNLLSNALKFTSEGSIEVSVKLKSHQSQPVIAFTVADTGIGMDKADLDKLFRPFTQVDMSATRNFAGTGLGLAICRGLVSAMGGDITVHSELGKGSAFTFWLPYIVADHSDEEQTGSEVFLSPWWRLGMEPGTAPVAPDTAAVSQVRREARQKAAELDVGQLLKYAQARLEQKKPEDR